jgi:hypothetical protein
MCSIRQTALTRSKWDDVHQADDARISSYAGRYAFVPFLNCPNSFPVNATTRLQGSGSGWVSGKWKTEVESDLKGIGRPPTKWRADTLLYNPTTNEMNNRPIQNSPDEVFPQNFNRLNNPPCTLRASGWNRWEPLLQNPQDTDDTPFDFFIPSRDKHKMKCRTHELK